MAIIFSRHFFWTLWHYSCYFGILGLFVAVTSFTTSCGNRDVVRNQVLRLAMGTLVWFTFTSLFEIIEYRSGICSVTKYLSKQKCAAKGYRWKGFDISGIHEKNREILFTQSVTLLFFTRFFKLNLTQKSCFCQIELTFVAMKNNFYQIMLIFVLIIS